MSKMCPDELEAALDGDAALIAQGSAKRHAKPRSSRGVRKPVRHAVRAYSWTSPPSRSRRWMWSGGLELTRRR